MKMTTVNLFIKSCFECPCYIENEDEYGGHVHKFCGIQQTLRTPSVSFIFNGNVPEKCPLRSIKAVTIQLGE